MSFLLCGVAVYVCIDVYILILRLADHVLKAHVLETPVEYKTPGGKPLDIYLV
jgi:hypothetical protein